MISDSTCVTSEFWCEVLSMFLLQKFVLRPTYNQNPESLAPFDYDSVKVFRKTAQNWAFQAQNSANCPQLQI